MRIHCGKLWFTSFFTICFLLLVCYYDSLKVLEVIATSSLAILGILFFYLWESEDKKEQEIEEQYDSLKNLVYDMNDALGHIYGIADKFHNNTVPLIWKFISTTETPEQFRQEAITALLILRQHVGRHNLESLRAIRIFMDSFNESLIRHNITNFTGYPLLTFTFNFHDQLLNSVFNNFKQFDLKEFKELRVKLLSLRHIYNVYNTNVKYVFQGRNGQNIMLANNNQYYFVHDFAENCVNLLKELQKNKKMNLFYRMEKIKLANLTTLL